MAIVTTSLVATTTPQALISTATTWAHLRGASLTDRVPFSAFNDGTIRVRIGGSGLTTVAGAGFPLLSSATFVADLAGDEAVFVVTSASTANIHLIAGRQ